MVITEKYFTSHIYLFRKRQNFLQLSFVMQSSKFLVLVLFSVVMGKMSIIQDLSILSKSKCDIMLTLRNHPIEAILKENDHVSFPNRASKINILLAKLKKSVSKLHEPILQMLIKYPEVSVESFWITNQIIVRNAYPDLIRILAEVADLTEIIEETVYPVAPTFDAVPATHPNGSVAWGIKKIGADKVWKYTKGEGVVVGIIDTGVRGSHFALRENYVGIDNNGWFDPISNTQQPTDDIGHGTHCAGVICGKYGIGLAPKAKWMACRGCDAKGCPQSALITCGQWMVCPTDPLGNNMNCTYSPDIISNSWGTHGGQKWYNEVIKAWNAVGIIGFFAVGNGGPNCSTSESPGDQGGVISVGSTNSHDAVSTFSSRGPSVDKPGILVPSIVAPGEGINSAYHLADDDYHILSGTSMATPHAAGAAALLKAANNSLTLEDMMDLMFSTTQQNLNESIHICETQLDGQFPNILAGHGRLDVNKAFHKLHAILTIK